MIEYIVGGTAIISSAIAVATAITSWRRIISREAGEDAATRINQLSMLERQSAIITRLDAHSIKLDKVSNTVSSLVTRVTRNEEEIDRIRNKQNSK